MSGQSNTLFPNAPLVSPVPGQPNLDAYYDNPSRSSPGSRTALIPAYWSDTPRPLVFAVPGAFPADQLGNLVYGPNSTAGTLGRALYTSPIFDLKPELGPSDGVEANARPISVVPIAFRGDTRLNITIRNIASVVAPTIMQAYSVESGDPINPAIQPPAVVPAANQQAYGKSPYFGQRLNITSAVFDFANGPEGATMVSWRPPRGLRYWQVTLVLDITVAPVPAAGLLIAYGALE